MTGEVCEHGFAVADGEPCDQGCRPPGDLLDRVVPAGSWILDRPETIPAVWGDGSSVGWAKGQSLFLVAPTGVGKTTLGVQILWAGLGIGDPEVLGMPVGPFAKKVLYLAMDRPEQIAHAMRRVTSEEHRGMLDAKMSILPCPMIADPRTDPSLMLRMCQQGGFTTVVVDSAKDLLPKLTDDEAGGAFNRAIQLLSANGIDVMVLHHQRKGQNGSKPKTIEDVYGSSLITNGAGSIILLWPDSGPDIELIHLKQPAAAIGPLQIVLDKDAGRFSLPYTWDPLAYLDNIGPSGATVRDATRARLGRTTVDRGDQEVTRRILKKLVDHGSAAIIKSRATPDGRTPTRYTTTGQDW